VLISGYRWTKFTPPFTPLKNMKVGIQNKEGRLILVWNDGKRRTMAIGLPDTPPARALAEKTKAEIEWDWHIKQYDPTLLKYKPRTVGSNATEISVPELFDRFTKYQAKDKRLSQSSIDTRYQPLKRMLEKYLNIPADDVGKRQVERFADICDDNLTAGTAKARFWLLASCWDWAKGRYHVAEENPFRGFNRRFQSTEHRPKPKPFTADEISKILGEFRVNVYYSHYHYVVFLLGVGSRIGETAGLRWQHVADDCESVHICRSIARGHEGQAKTKPLANREDYVSVAKALGHPPRVLHDNYAEVIESRSVINTLELIQGIGSEGAHE
jgi:integrase